MKWINYHHLIYFREIANKGTISKASKTLNVGQPALSSQLKSLEEHLGVELFERKSKRLYITEVGKVALEYAEKINSLGQELLNVVNEKAFTKEINLSIGALDSIPKHLICDIVDFAHKKTGCFLSIYEDTIDSLLRKLNNHIIEIIISDHPIKNMENDQVFSKMILHKPIIAYASPKFKHIKKNFPHSLNGIPCILPTKHSKIRHDIEIYFEKHNVEPKIIAETQDTALQKILSSKGDGVVFLPLFSTKEFVQYKKLIKIGDIENVYAEYFLIYAKRIFENPALDLILKQNFEKMRLGRD